MTISTILFRNKLMNQTGLILYLIKRDFKKLDIPFFLTIVLIPFLLSILIIHGFNISIPFVITGAVVYNAVWFGFLSALIINEDKHSGFLDHVIMSNKLAFYFISTFLLAFILSIVESVIMLSIFGIPIPILTPIAVLIASLIPIIIGIVLTFKTNLTHTMFMQTINAIFVLLSYSGNTIIPIKTSLILFNPLYYLVSLLRL